MLNSNMNNCPQMVDEWLTKFIRAIRIFPFVFQLMVDDTRKVSEHNANMIAIEIGINVIQ